MESGHDTPGSSVEDSVVVEREDEENGHLVISKSKSQELFIILEPVPSSQDISQMSTDPREDTSVGTAASSGHNPPAPPPVHQAQIRRQKWTRKDLVKKQIEWRNTILEKMRAEHQDRVAELQERQQQNIFASHGSDGAPDGMLEKNPFLPVPHSSHEK